MDANQRISGDVTIFFSDIEGSTRLWEQRPDLMTGVIERHMGMLDEVISSYSGRVVEGTGDGVYAVFDTATDGVLAAVALQEAIRAESWSVGELKARMGLHSGRVQRSSTGFHGAEVNRAARVMSVGYGGQVLISEATQTLLQDDPVPGLHFLDRGSHELKDLTRPMGIFEVTGNGLEADPRPLRSMKVMPTNLPSELTPFLDRAHDLSEVVGLMRRSRVATLTGPPGVGKSRLAMQVGADLLDETEAGVWVVDLADLDEPELLADAILEALHVEGAAGSNRLAALAAHIGRGDHVLLLDNGGHLVDAIAHAVSELISSCQHLRVLVTSRAPLHITGEVTWEVDPLDVPPPGASADEIIASAAVELFAERARAVASDFELDDHLEGVAEVCRLLDGVPLAVVLAAARAKVLAPAEIAERLRESSSLLATRDRSVHERHRTLEAALSWSYDLLEPDVQLLFRRLSIFDGTFTLDAAEQVCADETIASFDVLDLLSELLDRSLVVRDRTVAGESQYRMLRTFDVFGRRLLAESGEEDTLAQRHLDWVSGFARAASPGLDLDEQREWLDRVEAELDNIREAVRHAVGAGAVDAAARIVVELDGHWLTRAPNQGLYLLRELGEGVAGLDEDLRADLEAVEGALAEMCGERERATGLLEASRQRALALDDQAALGRAEYHLARAGYGTDPIDTTHDLLEAARAHLRSVDQQSGETQVLLLLAQLDAEFGDQERALRLARQAEALARGIGSPRLIAHVAEATGFTAGLLGDASTARTRLREALTAYATLDSVPCGAHGLEFTAAWLLTDEQPEAATIVLGATAALRAAIGVPVPAHRTITVERATARALGELGPEAYRDAHLRGADLTFHETLAVAQQHLGAERRATPRPIDPPRPSQTGG